MWGVVGLGNPGAKYARTRHNAGFMAVEELSARHGIELKEKPLYLIGKGSIDGEEVVLIEPLTFMNRSGSAVRDILSRRNIPPEKLIVLHDDIDMETGRLKVKRGGSSGGHNGIQSIIESIGARDFIRVKIGIGRDPLIPPEEYVLRKFLPEEKPVVRAAIKTAADAVEELLKRGLASAMNLYNKKPPML